MVSTLNRLRDPNTRVKITTWQTKNNGLWGWTARYESTGKWACNGGFFKTEAEAQEAAEALLNAE